MIYGSVCSGIEAASAAWHGLGWKPSFFSEIEPFPRAVLNHHYPEVPLHGDFTTIKENDYQPIDLLVGGTPCQAFSVAGLRKGLDDPRGNLTLAFLGLIDRLRPEWVVWENVPGVLSIDGGKTFGTFLGGLGELGYGFAYRVLDAQWFGVAQRRRRVFVVANARDWRRAAAVLLERDCLCGNPPPSREKGQRVAAPAKGSSGVGGDSVGALCARYYKGVGSQFVDEGKVIPAWPVQVAPTLNAAFGNKQGLEDQHALGGAGLFVPAPIFVTSGQTNAAFLEDQAHTLMAANEQPYVAVAQPISYGIPGNWIGRKPENGGNAVEPMVEVSPCLTSADKHGVAQPMAYDKYNDSIHEIAPTVAAANTGRVNGVLVPNMAVRRLTPIECERLQGFPDNYTAIPWRNKPATECPDGPRYKALGNSMAVPVMRWIGERIQMLEGLVPNSLHPNNPTHSS